MITPNQALQQIPISLLQPLLNEYSSIINNYLEHRWGPSEISMGRFCEIVFTILDGYAKNQYANTPSKPRDFVASCRQLEQYTQIPRSFRILIPRLLPALYEIRNNRGVGHVGGDVDPNLMDSTVVVSMTSWIMAELIRVFHQVSTAEAQQLVDQLVERRVPLVWNSGNIRRVLSNKLTYKDKSLLLIASSSTKVLVDELQIWLEYKNTSNFRKMLRTLHSDRLLEYNRETKEVELLPPGVDYVSDLLMKLSN